MKSKYKYVYLHKRVNPKKKKWIAIAQKDGKKIQKSFKCEKEAAKWVDIQLIKLGLDPVNILKRK